jgi:ribosomal protein L20
MQWLQLRKDLTKASNDTRRKKKALERAEEDYGRDSPPAKVAEDKLRRSEDFLKDLRKQVGEAWD